MKPAAIAEKTAQTVSTFIAMTTGMASFIISILVVYSVVARELFYVSENGVSEISTYLMTYITFVGAAFGLWEGAHVSVRLLIARLQGQKRTITLLLANVLVAALAVLLTWLAAVFWVDAWHSGERAWGTLSIPLWIPYSTLLFGNAAFLLVQIIRIALFRFDFSQSEH